MFKIEIETGNAAFGDNADDEKWEIVRILHEVADRLSFSEGRYVRQAYDINGNVVGRVTWERDA